MKSSFVIETLDDPSSTLWSSSAKPLQQTHDPQEEESLGSVVRKLHLFFPLLLLLLHKSLFSLPNYSHVCGLASSKPGEACSLASFFPPISLALAFGNRYDDVTFEFDMSNMLQAI